MVLVQRASCKTPRAGKIALLSHFAVPPPSPTPLSMSSAAGQGAEGGPGKLTQNHRFFRVGEFCNWLNRRKRKILIYKYHRLSYEEIEEVEYEL